MNMTPQTCVTSYAQLPTSIFTNSITPPTSLSTPFAPPLFPFGFIPINGVDSSYFPSVCLPSLISGIPSLTDCISYFIQGSQAAQVSQYLLNSEALSTLAATASSVPSYLQASSQAYSPIGTSYLPFASLSPTVSLPSPITTSLLNVGPGLGVPCSSVDEIIFKKPLLETTLSRKRKAVDDEMTDFANSLSISEISDVLMQKGIEQLSSPSGKATRISRKYTRRLDKSEEEQDRRKRNLEAVRKHRARINENIEILPQAIQLLNEKKDKLDKQLESLEKKFLQLESCLKQSNSSLYSKWIEQEQRYAISV